MSLNEKEIDVRVKVIQDGFAGSMKNVESTVANATKNIESSFLGAGGALNSLKGALTGFAEAAAAAFAIEKIAQFVEHTAELGVQLERLSQKTGISAEELGGLKAAAEETGTPMDSLAKGMQFLAKSMQAATEGAKGPGAKALKELGISATDATGHMRPMEDVMLDVADRFQGMEDGATKTALAMRIFGRGGAEMIPFLNQGGDSIRKMKEEAVSLGAVMSQQGVEDSEKYHQAMTKIGLVGQSISITIGQALMPAITGIAEAFVDSAKNGGAVADILVVLKGAFEGLALTIDLVAAAVEQVFAVLEFTVKGAFHSIGGLGTAIYDALHGNFLGARDAMAQTEKQMQRDFDQMASTMVSSAQRVNDQLSRMFGGSGAAPDQEHTVKTAGPTGGGGPGKDTRHAELAALMEGFRLEEEAAQGNADKIVEIRQRELAATRRLFAENSKEVLRAQLELVKAEDAHRKEATKTADDLIAAERDRALTSITIARNAVQTKLALGQISASQELEQLQKLSDEELAIRLKAAEAERDLLDQNTEAYRQAAAKVAAIMAQQEIAQKTNANAITVSLKTQWEGVFSHITNAFQSSIQGIIQGTQTLRGALANIFQSITLEFIQSGIKRLTSHIATELAMTQASAAGGATRASIDWGAAAASVAAGAWAAITNIANYAAQAIAAAWAAISAIPLVGPFMAPAIALGAGAAIFALAGDIKSASGGYDVPGGINPVTQLHAREMVLPAHLADRVRGMAGDGAGSGDTHHWHVQVDTIDRRGVEKFFSQNTDHIAKAIGKAHRKGELG